MLSKSKSLMSIGGEMGSPSSSKLFPCSSVLAPSPAPAARGCWMSPGNRTLLWKPDGWAYQNLV